MTNTQELILQVFQDFKTAREGVLKPQSLDTRVRKWERPAQEEAAEALQGLMAEDYVSTKEGWYVLTGKGYDYIYRNHSVAETEKIIRQELKRRNLAAGNSILLNWFNTLKHEIDRYHFDHFNEAFQNLVNEEIMEAAERGYKLTDKGYNQLYSN